MLNRVFPQHFDNNYRGHKLALWLFIPIVLMKVGISLSSIFDTYNVVRSADGIPIDAFTPRGAEAVVSVTTLLGLSQFLLALRVAGQYSLPVSGEAHPVVIK